MPRSRQVAAAITLATAALVGSAPLVAQERRWSGQGELAASLFQGNTDQRVMFAKAELGRADSTLELRGSLSFGYADAAPDSARREVTKRTWLGALALDYRPQDRVSPFVFLNYESSYEKRILDRVGAGAGGKLVLLRDEATSANVSLALLVERLRPTEIALDSAASSKTRWSGRVRWRHQFDERLRVSHTTYYQPQVSRFESYTVNSLTELAYALRETTSLTLSYFSLYDNDARARGARSNNDAQLLVGVKAGF